MSIHCTFHRATSAHFLCPECDTAFCRDCVAIRHDGYAGSKREYLCPGCNVSVQMLSLGNIVPPFWQNIGPFFLYPFQPVPLVLMVTLALLGAFVPSIFVQIGVFVVMMKYAYATLTYTAQGSYRAPELSWDLINSDVFQVFKQFIVFAIIGAGIFIISVYLGSMVAVVFTLLASLAAPAIIMVLVATNSILHAINPVTFMSIIFRIGWSYLLMTFFLSILLLAPAVLSSHILPGIFPEKVYRLINFLLQHYYLLIYYRLMGYVLLQYHQEIGYPVDYEYFIKNRGYDEIIDTRRQNDELGRGLAILIKLGKYEQAIEQLRSHMLGSEVRLELSEKYYQLLQMAGRRREVVRYRAHYLELLVKKKKKSKALSLFSEIRFDEENSLKPETLFQLALWSAEERKFQKAISTCVYISKQYKQHRILPEVYFELAGLLHKHGNNSAKAKQILQGVLKSYPQHVLVPKVARYLNLLAKEPGVGES